MHKYEIKITFDFQNNHYNGKIDSQDASVRIAMLERMAQYSVQLRHCTVLEYKISNTCVERQFLYRKGFAYRGHFSASILYQSQIEAQNVPSALNKAIDEFYSEIYYGFSGEKRDLTNIEYTKAFVLCCISDNGVSIEGQDITSQVKSRVARNIRKSRERQHHI